MIQVRGLDGLLAIITAVGLVGCLAALKARHWRVRWLVITGETLALVGFGLVGIIVFGLLPRIGGLPERLVAAAATAFTPRLNASASGRISWITEQQTLDRAESGTLPVGEFEELLGSAVSNRSYGSRGGSCILAAIERLRSGRLPAPYVDALADWLIGDWPRWQVGGAEIDDVPGAVLASGALSEAARDRFIEFMLARYADPVLPPGHGWSEALNRAALVGKMDHGTLERYLLELSAPVLELDPRSGPVVAGGTATCRVRLRTQVTSSRSLPWECTVRWLSGGQLLTGGNVRLSAWSFEEPAAWATISLPDTPGEMMIVADATLSLSRDDLRGVFGPNPLHRPRGMDLENWEDVSVARQITLPLRVLPRPGESPRLLDPQPEDADPC